LIQECWRVRRKERPNFDQIVARLQGDIGDEIKRKEEPKIELYSKEDDLIYRNRVGKEDELSDSDEEEGGGKSTRRGDVVSKSKHEKALAAKDKAMQELREKMNKEMNVVKRRAEAEKKRAEQEKKQVEAEKKRAEQEKKQVEAALQEKTAKEQLWGAALQEVSIASPEDLRKLAEAHKRVMEELEERKERA
jgi:colicin import membrane protein